MGNNRINMISDRVLGGVSAGIYRQAPWHGMGEITATDGTVIGVKRPIEDDIRTRITMATLADLEWEPQEVKLSDISPGLVSDRKILIRAGWPTIGQRFELGVHSQKYGVITNDLGLSFIEEILKQRPDGKLQSVTSLYGGKIVFGCVEFRDGIQVTRRNGEKTDSHTPYMGVYWSHDGSYPLGVKYMRHEWVCENTFTPWNAETGLVVRHTVNADSIARTALTAIEGMMTAQDAFDIEIERLLNIEMSRFEFKQDLKAHVIGSQPMPNVKLTDKGVSTNTRNVTNWENRFEAIVKEWDEYTDKATAFDAVMAVQGYEQHRQTVRGGGRDAKAITRLMRDEFPMTAAMANALAVSPA